VNAVVGSVVAIFLLDNSFDKIFAVFFVIGATGMIALFALRRIDHTVPEKRESILDLFLSTARLFEDKKIWCLIFLVLYSGFSASFFAGFFPLMIGKHNVPYAQLAYGLAEVTGSFAAGKLGQRIGRLPILASSFIFHASSLTVAILCANWHPAGGSHEERLRVVLFCATTALFGLGDSCLQTMVYSILGNLYSDRSEAAFAWYKFSQSIGYTICFLMSVRLVDSPTIIIGILAGILFCALGGILTLQLAIVNVNKDIKISNRL